MGFPGFRPGFSCWVSRQKDISFKVFNYLGFSWFLAVSWVEKPVEIADPTY